MAKKRAGWEMLVYYGTAGSAADTHISANVQDVDPGVGGWEYADNPDRGDGTKVPGQDEMPVKRTYAPTFSMIYKDGDTHMAALLAAADANPPVGKSFLFKRYTGAANLSSFDYYINYTSPGPIGDGQIVEFELHPTSDYGRAVS